MLASLGELREENSVLVHEGNFMLADTLTFLHNGYNLHATAEGVVFRDSTCDTGYFFDGSAIIPVSAIRYWELAIGRNWRRVLAHWGSGPGTVAHAEDGRLAAARFDEEMVHVFDHQGQCQSHFWGPSASGGGVYSVAWLREALWLAVPTDMAVYRVACDGKQLQIVGKPFDNTSDLSYPEHIFSHGGKLYISEMGNRRISVYDPQEDTLKTCAAFGGSETVWECVFSPALQRWIVKLESGIYLG
jgi:hypothetical protein